MGPAILNKTPVYGDINQGYTVTEELSKCCAGIDTRNPAVVKFARLLLGTDEAIRDSIDDIASYAAKATDGRLSFVTAELPIEAKEALVSIKMHATNYSLTPTELAYVVAFFGCIKRGSFFAAYTTLAEYYEYTVSIGDEPDSSRFAALIGGAVELTRRLRIHKDEAARVSTNAALKEG